METQPAAQASPPPASNRVASYIGAGMGVFASLLPFTLWLQSGRAWHLLSALAFAAMTPAWYLRPISFTQPVGDLWKLRQAPLPRVATWLVMAGFFLLGASVLLRLTA